MDIDTDGRGKRLRRVEIRGERIEDYFTGDMTVIEALPDDSRLVDMWNDPRRQTYNLVFESEEFPVVAEGAEIPEADILVAERRCNNVTHWVCPNCFETHENGDVIQQ